MKKRRFIGASDRIGGPEKVSWASATGEARYIDKKNRNITDLIANIGNRT